MLSEDPIKPEGFDELINLIERSNNESGSSEVQETVLKQSYQYLLQNQHNQHWFCDSYMFRPATHALILFSFPNNQLLSKLQPFIKRSLTSCEDCLRYFNRGKAELRLNFAINKGIKLNMVDQFLAVLVQWESSILGPMLTNINNELLNLITLTNEVNISIAWCLNNPTILRNERIVREEFTRLIKYLYGNKLLPLPNQLFPGMIYLMFEGCTEEKRWVKQCFSRLLESKFQFNKLTLEEEVIHEFSIHFYRIQKSDFYNDRNAIIFWGNFYTILDFIDDESFILRFNTPKDIKVMSESTELRFYPIIRLLMNSLMSYLKEPLPILLKVFSKLLGRYKTKFWAFSTPINHIQILDSVLSNPEFSRQLQSAAIDAHGVNDWTLDEITAWMFNLLPSLTKAQKNTSCIRLGLFLLKQNIATASIYDDRLKKMKLLQNIGCRILLSGFDDVSLDQDISEKNFSVSLMTVRDIRTSIEYEADQIVDLSFDSQESNLAMQLVVKCMNYDLSILAHNTALLQQDVPPTTFDTFPLLWETLCKRKIYSNLLLAKQLVGSLKLTSKVIQFAPQKNQESNKQLFDSKKQHYENVSRIGNLAKQLLEKLSLADEGIIKNIIEDGSCSDAIWACVFSPLLSQSALGLFNGVFDADGRFETFQAVLSKNLGVTLASINLNLDVLTKLQAYEPTPKAVRIMMDVVRALCDPLSPILGTSSQVSENGDQIIQLWKNSWSFLVMIYQRTFVWANQFHLEELVEFTRDVLDFSHLLIDSFRIILDNINAHTPEDTPTRLFKVFMSAFHYVVVWLRLGDLSLLNSCVDLVFKGFSLAAENHFTIDTEFIENFARFGAKAKKFNSKLSETQRQQILSTAREFDYELVDRIQEDAIQHRQAKHKVEVIDITDSEETPEPPSSSQYSSRSVTPKQQTLGRFGVVTNEPPIAPPPLIKKFQSTNLEAIRKELKSARVAPAKPVAAPALPRPAGYNSKKAPPVIGRSLNALKKKRVDSDSSDEEPDTDLSDLFVDKGKKKPKIIEVDHNLREINRSLARKRVVDQAKLEQERMRMRLNVNLKPLYDNILRWNYNVKRDYPTEDTSMYEQVKDRYKDANEYVKVTEPLLMLECWQGIQSAKDTGTELPFELLIGSRTSVDGFFDVFASIEKKTLQDRRIGESDLLVLGFMNDYISNPRLMRSYLKAESTITCLAKVREIKSANAEFADITFRVYPSGPLMGALTPKSIIVAMRVMQMTTVEREFASLKGLQYYDLLTPILHAEANRPMEVDDEEAEKMRKVFDVNKSQAKAIMGTFKSEGFSLIQGPPGTGKTKTILGIVGYSLSHQKDTKIIDAPGQKAPVTDQAKVLICAPSNAAVDELVVRLRDGVRNANGQHMPLRVVRLGRSDAINASVRDLTLEELVDKELQERSFDVSIDPTIRQEHTKCIKERDQIRARLNTESLDEKETTELETRLREVNKKRNELAKRLDEQRERASIAYRTKEIDRRNIQARILSQAQVICSTLSGSAHDFLANLSVKFDQVIIDEACQCVELSAIIPLRYGCKKCIMVGDPNQLPPTVLSQAAASYNYEQSLFVRMQKNNPSSVYLLDVQYRMHPMISRFPSAEFYKSKLKDGEGMEEKTTRPWHAELPLTPYRFFDILSKHERDKTSKSLFNQEEARVALELVEKLMNILPEKKFAGRIGIISPYKEQIGTIRSMFVKKYGRIITDEIDFNTVDGFQGQEKEIIIMSCVRASPSGNVGFLSDVRRMNVALTRARTTLWILGNRSSLSRNGVWRRLLEDADSRGCLSQAYPGFMNTSTGEKRKADQENSSGSKSKKSKKEKKERNENKDKSNKSESNEQSESKKPKGVTKPNEESAAKIQPVRSGIFTAQHPVPKRLPTKADSLAAAHRLQAEKSQHRNMVPPVSTLPNLPPSSAINQPARTPSPTSVGYLPSKPTHDGVRKTPPITNAGYLPSKPQSNNLQSNVMIPTKSGMIGAVPSSNSQDTSTFRPTSSGHIKPPLPRPNVPAPKKSPGSIFIQKRKPPPKR
ncbi:SEN1 [[Candida] subhashii]|uniref:SEN1 n=1 Tax=[Candida] subhashii TaxID=561895 RepID=A0A8J5QQJ0_9ASCO|nr:SEN1 [[Candida] subhashii]KAG7664856.1 SEN1 [[Candida] subhashii]